MKNGFYSFLNINICGFKKLSTMNQFKDYLNKHAAIIMVFTIITISILNSSCKTCKCPAYSQTEYKIPANSGYSTV